MLENWCKGRANIELAFCSPREACVFIDAVKSLFDGGFFLKQERKQSSCNIIFDILSSSLPLLSRVSFIFFQNQSICVIYFKVSKRILQMCKNR